MNKRVYLVGQSEINLEAVGELFDAMGVENKGCLEPTVDSADLLPELGGRICYMSYDKPRPGGNKAYLDHIKEVGHGSVLEHSVFNFVIISVSRTFTHELVRHRVGTAFSQLSQRYVDESNGSNVIPDIYEKLSPDLNAQVADLVDVSRQLYTDIANDLATKGIDRKSARGAARAMLLGCNDTKIMFSVNARELRHIFDMRGSIHAEIEIRGVTREMYQLVSHLNLFSDYKIIDADDPVKFQVVRS